MKIYNSHLRTNDLLEVYSLFLRKMVTERAGNGKQMSALEKLVLWIFTVSSFTSRCERGFSILTCNVIKNKLRTVLTTESLQNQLYIKTMVQL